MLQKAMIFGLLGAVALSGCGTLGAIGGSRTAEDAPPAPVSQSDGVASNLELGITKAVVDVALGPDAGFERNPNNFDESCASYPYADGKKYVHAVFDKDKLMRATDGHPLICTYGSIAPAN